MQIFTAAKKKMYPLHNWTNFALRSSKMQTPLEHPQRRDAYWSKASKSYLRNLKPRDSEHECFTRQSNVLFETFDSVKPHSWNDFSVIVQQNMQKDDVGIYTV